jgi:two-component system, sensor histidine kinase
MESVMPNQNNPNEQLRLACVDGPSDNRRSSIGEAGALDRMMPELWDLTPLEDALEERIEHLHDLLRECTAALSKECAIRQDLERQLRESHAMADQAICDKNTFLATMSHDIRAPLTAILGYSELLYRLGDVHNAPSERIEMLSAIKRNSSQLLELITDLLDFTQFKSDQFELAPIETDPLLLVFEVAADFLTTANSKGLKLHVECTTPIPHQILTDPKRFRQILTNLVVNAIKFTNEGDVIIRLASRELTSASACFVVTVEDTGIGIPADRQSVIFEPFTHGHNEQISHQTGTGLGLAICRQLVESSGGTIAMASEKGVGSKFTFTVPITSNAPVWQPNAHDLTIREPVALKWDTPDVNLTDFRIMIVDDTTDTRDLLKLIFSEAGADVTTASNGLDGVAMTLDAMSDKRPFDFVLMDMRMPGMSGHVATSRLRDEGYQNPIVALTANVQAGDEQACLDAGCSTYLTKPIETSKLFETIEQLLPELMEHKRHDNENRPTALISEKSTDSRFLPLLQKYMARLPIVLEELRTAQRDGNTESMLDIVHRLRGTAVNYGYPLITEAATQCQTAIHTNNFPEKQLNKTLNRLTNLVDSALKSYRNENDNHAKHNA